MPPRRGVEANRQAQQPATPTPTAKPAPRIEPVTAKCGHAVPFELFPDGKDRWRESRLKLVIDRDCPDYRRKAGEAKQLAEQEAARLRREERAKARPPAAAKDRLPHGSRFDVSYDAAGARWSGTLTVPGLAPIAASASAVFKLLRRLDDL